MTLTYNMFPWHPGFPSFFVTAPDVFSRGPYNSEEAEPTCRDSEIDPGWTSGQD